MIPVQSKVEVEDIIWSFKHRINAAVKDRVGFFCIHDLE